MKKYIIAIDGGTTNTRVTLWQEPGVCVDTVKAEVGVRVTSMEGSNAALKAAVKDILEQLLQHNGIGPGYIATQQTAPLRQPQEDGSRHPFDQFIISKTPAGRWGEAEDLAGPAVFLASDASNFVNGHILYVDGGILAYIGKQP